MLQRSLQIASLILLLGIPMTSFSQGSTEPIIVKSSLYQMPTRDDWNAAGLAPEEYDMAVQYKSSIAVWKKMNDSRRAHVTAGWACIGVGLLAGAVEATVIMASDIDISLHPEQEVFIMSTVAMGATALTGLIILLTAPGPEDLRNRPQEELPKFASFDLGGGVSLRPQPMGLRLDF